MNAASQVGKSRLQESRFRSWQLLPALALILAGLAWPWFSGSADSQPAQPAVAVNPVSQPAIEFVPIVEIEVGQRVPAENPLGEWDDSLGDEVDPPTWRKLTLRAPKVDGTHADVVLLRPLTWLDQHEARVGGTVFISVPECGIDGNAEVLAIDPCPAIQSGPGQVVTGKYRHASADVIDLHVEGLSEPIGVTRNHRFWSEDRQAFVPAGTLQIGEQLCGLDGTCRVHAIETRVAAEPVYNLETHGTHTYCVSVSGLIVHNLDFPCEEAKRYYLELRKTHGKDAAKKLYRTSTEPERIEYRFSRGFLGC